MVSPFQGDPFEDIYGVSFVHTELLPLDSGDWNDGMALVRF